MSKIYDIAFRMGVLFNVLLWTVLNLISFSVAREEIVEKIERSRLFFTIDTELTWGFPFKMFRGNFFFREDFLALNAIIYVLCGFMFGFLFKFVRSKISRQRA
jgi:hypothetical protein